MLKNLSHGVCRSGVKYSPTGPVPYSPTNVGQYSPTHPDGGGDANNGKKE
jgi:hypothetical protein